MKSGLSGNMYWLGARIPHGKRQLWGHIWSWPDCPQPIFSTLFATGQQRNGLCINLLLSGFVANSKYKIQALFKEPNCIFQAPKLSTKSHILDADIQNLDCNLTLMFKFCQSPSTGDMHTSACFKIVNKCKISKFARFKFKDFSRIFKYFQAPYLFSKTFKGLEVFIPNSSIFKDFSSTL